MAEQWLAFLDRWRLKVQSLYLTRDSHVNRSCEILVLIGRKFDSLGILSDCKWLMLSLGRRRGKVFEGSSGYVDVIGLANDLGLHLYLGCEWVLQNVRILHLCKYWLGMRLYLDVMLWLELDRLRFDLIVQLRLALVI